jgi:hypothetical protein
VARGGEAGDPRGLRRDVRTSAFAWDPSCWRPRWARVCSAGRSPSWASTRFSSARPPAAIRSSGPSRPMSRCSSFTPTHLICPRARCALPAPPVTKTRRSMSGGPRMRSSAIWSLRSTTPVTGSTARSGRHSRPVTDVAPSQASWRSTASGVGTATVSDKGLLGRAREQEVARRGPGRPQWRGCDLR